MFRPKNGEKAQWRCIYELAAAKVEGEVVTYQEIAAATGVTARAGMQSIVHIAKPRLLEDFKYALVAVREGYRITVHNERIVVVGKSRTKTRHAVGRTRALSHHVDLNRVDADADRAALQDARDLSNRLYLMLADMTKRRTRREMTLDKIVNG